MKNDGQKARYVAARDKLRAGMLSMLEHYARQETEDETGELAGWADDRLRERFRQDARTDLLAEIGNFDNPPLHVSIPENELSSCAFAALSEAYWAICGEAQMWHRKGQSK